jgi:hypothetical protein
MRGVIWRDRLQHPTSHQAHYVSQTGITNVEALAMMTDARPGSVGAVLQRTHMLRLCKHNAPHSEAVALGKPFDILSEYRLKAPFCLRTLRVGRRWLL